METRLKLIAFDLDYTLWPFRLDTDVVAPFQKRSNGNIVDSKGTKLNCYHEVPGILKSLDEDGFILAIVSRIAKTKAARQLLEIIGWDSFFSFKEIYPGHKSLHFQRIKDQSKIDYHEMLFFDDEERNVRRVSHLGVTCILVKNGLTSILVGDSIKEHGVRISPM